MTLPEGRAPDAETIETIVGPLAVPPEPDLIFRSLREHGEWAWSEVQLAASLLQPGETVWDVGAFLGTFGLGVSQTAQAGTLLAIEANPVLVPLLRANLAANAPCPVTLVETAVGEFSGQMRQAGGRDGNLGATRFEVAATPDDDTVPCRTLRDVRLEHGDYDMLKLDIEGLEPEALKGDFGYLQDRQPVIWAECNESVSSMRMLSVLVSAGYQVWYVAFPAFRADNFRGAEDLLFPIAYEASLAAGPPERMEPLAALADRDDLLVTRIETTFELRRALWDTPRWGRAEWASMTRLQLLARLGRQFRRQNMSSFLKD